MADDAARVAQIRAQIAEWHDGERTRDAPWAWVDMALVCDALDAAEKMRDQALAAHRDLVELYRVKCGEGLRYAALAQAARAWRRHPHQHLITYPNLSCRVCGELTEASAALDAAPAEPT